ncbi:hypothetical protein BGZ61DRAFT_489864 [Ilyonectria robusta]|uniref:uncharacterized protein n=1 Tax=Ilyonectria robusta TaxID=1079257 RepID=UPI001E8E97E0|nr:uncharacterized protein BGZ61DRAFT_489864 [Ilyonectria robusta]KAH8736072.1 hypothetical protein BGZ61DRAFT_489864 [Ilyonectria robusta]
MKVAILGATGETGTSILNGLLESEITALVRPSSLQKPEVLALEKRGVKVAAADIYGPEEELTKLLRGMEVLQSCGIKRFVPCSFATIAPPKGILRLRDMKEDVINHIKRTYVPYTIIDVGWWFQLTLPALPSGRLDYALVGAPDAIAGDGSVPSALTDLRDVGRYVARIIADPRTLNQMVFAYNELLTQTQVYDLLERVSGETIQRNYVPVEDILAGAAEAAASDVTPDSPAFYKLAQFQYWHTWGIRGDNTPEYARYLGYLNAKELYPDLEGKTLEAYCQELLNGDGKGVYQQMKVALAKDSSSSMLPSTFSTRTSSILRDQASTVR